ncbi:MAG: hypothetical protein FJX62_04505 [Alphaproteobacteria bacterium]|nr:hypothetical protein [Alphaproteobacteria bacterium]
MMRRLWAVAVVVVAASAPSSARAQSGVDWHATPAQQLIESITFKDCRISARLGCAWTFQNYTWMVYFPADRAVARKIDGYYKQINFENLSCASVELQATVPCRIISVPFDREHMLFIDPVTTGSVGQTWRIDAPRAVRYDRESQNVPPVGSNR